MASTSQWEDASKTQGSHEASKGPLDVAQQVLMLSDKGACEPLEDGARDRGRANELAMRAKSVEDRDQLDS